MDPLQELEEKRARYPNAYYTVETNEPEAKLAARLRRDEYKLWQDLMPELTDDHEVAVRRLARLTGKTTGQVETWIAAIDRINSLPYLFALQELSFLLDQSRLSVIDQALAMVPPEYSDEVIAEIDRNIALYLVPTKPNQTLPTAGQLRRKIRDMIRVLCPKLDVDHEDEPDGTFADVDHGPKGVSYFNFSTSTETGVIMEAAIRTRAKELGVSFGEALRDIVINNTKVSVILNAYRAHDVENAPGYVFGAGWVHPSVADKLEEFVTKVRDMDQAATKVSSAYAAPDDIRAFVVGRDGICRFPGDNRRADKTQFDHVHDFKDGGVTAGDNGESLCQHHHNIKTDGRVQPILFPDGVIAWLFEDGHWEITEPEGPLAPKNRNWVRTVSERLTQMRRNHEKPEKPEKPTDPGEEDPFDGFDEDNPPF